MKSYPAYKDSGIEWLGKVPEHWSLSKLKHASEVNPRKGSSDFEKDSDELVTFLPMENVYENGRIDTSIQKPISELWSGYTYFENGDAIVAKITPCFENGKAAHLSDLNSPIGFGSTEFHVLRPRDGASDGRFLYYLIFSHVFRETGEAFMTGAAGQKRIPTQFVEEFELALPPLEEQRTIAAYLDRKTAQIDTLIAKKQRLIDLLQEQRTAVINRAVTQGLNPDAPMQDSGIDWLGKVPAHWDITKIKWVSETGSGTTPSTSKQDRYYGGGINWVQSLDLNEGVVSETEKTITETALAECSCNRMPERTVMVAMYGGSGTIGKTGVMGQLPNNPPSATNQAICSLVPEEVLDSDYLHYYLRFYRPYWMVNAMSTRRDPNISQDIIQNAPFLIPPLNEQRSIVEKLRETEAKIDSVVSQEKGILESLKELRTSLISEAVTGKIDVRDDVPQPAEVAA